MTNDKAVEKVQNYRKTSINHTKPFMFAVDYTNSFVIIENFI